MTDELPWYKDPLYALRLIGLFLIVFLVLCAINAPTNTGTPTKVVTYQTPQGKMICEKITGADPRETRLNCSLPTPVKITK